MRLFSLLLACIVALSASAQQSREEPPLLREELPPVTFISLLQGMLGLDALPTHPGKRYTVAQASSYDRKSTDPRVANEENWMANRDFVSKDDLAQFVRIDEKNGEKEYVLMDQAGPGAIVRIWSAVAERGGNIRIYLDGAETPVIDMPFSDLLGGTGPRVLLGQPEQPGKKELEADAVGKLFPSPICGQRSLGWNSYLPIPYAKHCKVVTTEANETYWYQITYRTYAEDREVETFSLSLAEQYGDTIDALAERLARPQVYREGQVRRRPGAVTRQEDSMLEPGVAGEMRVRMKDLALYELRINVESEDLAKILRGTLLEIFCDGSRDPQVQAPLGDFFATAPGINPYASLPSAVLEDGTLVSHWVMPCKMTMILKLSNYTDIRAIYRMQGTFDTRPWTKDSMYFHAKWRTEQHMRSMPRRDWNYIDIDGAGVYVGNMLHVANANKDWWGEGDEKIFVDGAKFPAVFGTGTEDYYGYACCSNKRFTHAYHNQTRCDGPGNSGHTCLSRFHLLDAVPFRKSLKFDMEIWHWDDGDISYAVTNYYYAKPKAKDNIQRPEPEELTIPELPEAKDRVGRNLFGDG